MITQTFRNFIATGVMGITAAAGLGGCVVSDDPVVNGVATAATVGVVTSLIYSISDGYYYDHDYNRMPRGYRPDRNVQVHRVSNIDDYRRMHPRGHTDGQPPRPRQEMRDDRRMPPRAEQRRDPQYRQNEMRGNPRNRMDDRRPYDDEYPRNRY